MEGESDLGVKKSVLINIMVFRRFCDELLGLLVVGPARLVYLFIYLKEKKKISR